jgi:hypothetical protein
MKVSKNQDCPFLCPLLYDVPLANGCGQLVDPTNAENGRNTSWISGQIYKWFLDPDALSIFLLFFAENMTDCLWDIYDVMSYAKKAFFKRLNFGLLETVTPFFESFC